MKIGIIGPGEVEKYCKNAGLDVEKYKERVNKIAEIIARLKHDIVVTPDKGSTSELFAQAYKQTKGRKINVLVPLEDKEFGYSWVNKKIADEVISCKTWRNQPEAMCENSDLLVCIGWGGGTLCEMYYTRWMGKVRAIYVISELIDVKLPKSLEKGYKILEYVKLSDLEKKLKALK